jgi:dipeptidyl-peptidase-4
MADLEPFSNYKPSFIRESPLNLTGQASGTHQATLMNDFAMRRVFRHVQHLRISLAFIAVSFSLAHADDPPFQQLGRSSIRPVYKSRITAHWFDDDKRFWYRNDLPQGRREYVLVDAEMGQRKAAFDHPRLAAALTSAGVKDADADRLAIDNLQFRTQENSLLFLTAGSNWRCDLATYTLEKVDKLPADNSSDRRAAALDNRPRASRRTGDETELTFVNQTGGEVELFWLDPSGTRRSYGKLAAGGERAQHTFAGHVWEILDQTGRSLAVFEADDEPSRAEISAVASTKKPNSRRSGRGLRRGTSPDGKWTAFIQDNNVFVRGGEPSEEFSLTQNGRAEQPYQIFDWSPDSRKLIVSLVEPGDQKQVHLVESSPADGGRAILHSREYPLPGDRFAAYELQVLDLANREQQKVDAERIDFGRPRVRWQPDSRHFTYEKADRGHQRFRLIEVDAETGKSRTIVDETSQTFIWTAHTENLAVSKVNWLEQSNEIVFVSEKDGWRHLYLIDAQTGSYKNAITCGEYVVRAVDQIDEENRQVWFRAGGRNSDQDPYLIHFYRVNFDGTGLTELTSGNGNHTVQYSPRHQYFIDTYSRVDVPPVHELRRASDGGLVCELERADTSALEEIGWRAPEVFSAKGRDGQTDIWGIISWPRNFDRTKKYPILEDIYAGPQSSYVPKSFSAVSRYQSLNELGFIVVKIDGMGTANRSKKFHDVCWHNLKDAGLPDRIAWIKAAAAKHAAFDLDRVGVFGTSAGGQNAAGAVLFHSDFYKAAVASCGCHDNRMDKASWNEQWMGYPVGPHYAECSNIDNAWRLNGKLMLIVGEMDTNVPPESTLRFAGALIKAKKDFDLVVIPGAGHGNGGEYGRRKMEDFFQRHLGNPK